MSYSIRILILLSIAMLAQSANAAKLALEMGLHAGGDDLITATFTSGTTQTVKAGQLISLSIGAGFDISKQVESRVTYGIKVDEVSASNGSIDFARYPLDMLVLYKAGMWDLGGGLTYHMSPKLSGSGAASIPTIKFDNALGYLLEADRFYSQRAYFGFRYTSIDYKVTGYNVTVSGNSIGVVIGAVF